MNITFTKDAVIDGQKMKKGSSYEASERIGQKMIDRGFAELTKDGPVVVEVEVEAEPEEAVEEDGAE